MQNPEELLTVPPLFYDALGGEFQPHSDRHGRNHTLGRLAFSAYLKGTRQQGTVMSTGQAVIESVYIPSWAPQVEATSLHVALTPDVAMLAGLRLYNQTSGRSMQADYYEPGGEDSDPNFAELLLISPQEEPQRVRLSLGSELEQARLQVAHTAHLFFNGRQ